MLRHTWVLQTKQTVMASLLSMLGGRPGFVEPDPRFWSALQQVVRRSREVLVSRGALGPDVHCLRNGARIIRERGAAIDAETLTDDERRALSGLGYPWVPGVRQAKPGGGGRDDVSQ